MCNWKIVSNYRACGLAFAVKVQQRYFKRTMGVQAHVARRMALIHVRTALVNAIDKGEL